jgi:hypothetical protein
MGQLYRTGAPSTSIDAAESIDSNALQMLVRETIIGFGSAGCISDEVREQLPELAYSSVTARYRALLDKGLIEVIGQRPGVSGRQQRVMRACWGRPMFEPEDKPSAKELRSYKRGVSDAIELVEKWDDTAGIVEELRTLKGK